MAEQTAIEWCDATFNPWMGCTRVSPACDDCYAARSTPARTLGVTWGAGEPRRRTSDANWKLPGQWNAKAAREGRRVRVFCASMADVFDNEVPVQWRRDLFDLIEATPNLDWLLLTKRIGNARRLYADTYLDSARPWPANVWLGATVVTQEELDRDLPKLYAVPARVRFLSIEPMLGPISFDAWPLFGEDEKSLLHWVICGGESGSKARPMNPDWARSLRDQCATAGVPFLFKQWGEWGDPDSIETTGLARHGWFEDDHRDGGAPRHEWPGPMVRGAEMASQRPEVFRVGTKAAGRLLDGTEHNGFPCAA
jgi:protein gp37